MQKKKKWRSDTSREPADLTPQLSRDLVGIGLSGIGKALRAAEQDERKRHKIVDSGLLKIEIPTDRGQVYADRLMRKYGRRLPFLRELTDPRIIQAALDEICKHGYSIGTNIDYLPTDAPPSVRDALQLLEEYKQLDLMLMENFGPSFLSALANELESNHRLPSDATPERRKEDSTLLFWRLLDRILAICFLRHRLEVRPFEPDVVRGRKTLEGLRASRKVRTEDRELEGAKYVAEFNRIKKQNPHMSKTRASGLVAKKFGVSARTISRSLPKK